MIIVLTRITKYSVGGRSDPEGIAHINALFSEVSFWRRHSRIGLLSVLLFSMFFEELI